MTIWREMQSALGDLEAAGLLRTPAVVADACGPRTSVDGREVVCLCSNDYLALANDPAVRAATIEAIERWGVGAGASRLVSGTTDLHVKLETRLAAFKNAPAAVVTPTGWMANHAAIHALTGSGDLIICDKLNHASILDAATSSGARVRTFPHRRVDRLEQLLARHRSRHRRCLIVTDSLFSMDGDLAPLREIVETKNHFDAQLLIDEAHATGVFGSGGRGVAEAMGVEDQIDATVGTLSKAIGSLGGFVAGPKVLIDTIRNTGRAFIYTTAPPPALCAAALKSLEIIAGQPRRRATLLSRADELRARLGQPGLDTGDSQSQIIPIIVGSADTAVQLSRELLERGFFVPAIRPPTVPRGTARLRVSLSYGHCPEDLSAFAAALTEANSSISSE